VATHPIFEFFASLKLAVVLLTMLIVAAIAGTLYESSFDAKVARAYVTERRGSISGLFARREPCLLRVFALALAQTSPLQFLITHLGIITLLMGSLIGRIWDRRNHDALQRRNRQLIGSSSMNTSFACTMWTGS